MHGWRIDVDAARGAIARAETTSSASLAALTEQFATVTAAASASTGSLTAAALSGIESEMLNPELTAVRSRLDAVFGGTRSAITAYEAGDDEMASAYPKAAR